MLPELFSTQAFSRKVLNKSLADGTLIKVGRGHVIKPLNSPDKWKRIRHVKLGQIASHALRCNTPPIYIGVTAAMLHGLAATSPRTDTAIHTAGHHFEKKLLPAWIDLDTSSGQPIRTPMPPTPLICHKIDVSKDNTKYLGHHLRVTDLATTTLHCTAWLPTENAQAIADSAAKKLITGWETANRSKQQALLKQIPHLQAQMTNLGNKYCNKSGAAQAREILANMDPRFESYAESLLHLASRLAQVKGLIPQFEVKVSAAQSYYLDAAIPKFRTAFEIDGMQKYHSADPEQTYAAIQGEKSRQSQLQKLGWHIYRFTYEDVSDVFGFANFLRSRLGTAWDGVSIPPWYRLRNSRLNL